MRKLYARNGFTDIVVMPSLIGRIAKPRGWCAAHEITATLLLYGY